MVGGHATVGRLSNNVFCTFQVIWENFEKSRWTVTRQWLRSRDRRPTVKQRFFDASSNLGKFWKKSLNGHAAVVGGHATVGRLSNNVFWTFQAIRKKFEKSRWTVTRQWSEVTRPSADCQTTFLDVSSDLGKFWKKSLNGHATVVGVTRPSADCQTTFFGRFKRFGKILKKVAERSRDSGWGHATVGRLSNNVFWTFQAILENFEKKSLNGHATVVGGHATVGRLSNSVFWTFQAILGKFRKKSLNGHATVVGGHATVDWLLNNVFGRFKQFGKILKKVAERSRDSDRKSRDHRPTVKQRFLDVSSNYKFFWKKSLNGHATVVGGHATVGRLSNNVFWTFQAIRIFFEKSRWTVTRQWSEVTRPSDDCQTTFFRRFKQLGNLL